MRRCKTDEIDDDIQKYRKQRSIEKEYPVFTSPSNIQYRTDGERVIEREGATKKGSNYNIFVKEKYAEIKEAYPEMDKTEIFAEIGRLWREENKEEKFNSNKDKISNIKPENTFKESKQKKIEEARKNKFEEIVKKYPNISFEEAILRSFHMTSVYYQDDYFIKKFKQLSNTNSSPPSPPLPPLPPKRRSPKSKTKITGKTLQEAKSKLKPKPPPYPRRYQFLHKRNSPELKTKITGKTLQEAKSKLKPKGPPYPPPQPTLPKRNSPKSKTIITEETLEEAKGKLKHSQIELKPDNPDYDLEMAFRKLENKSKSPPKSKSRKNENISNTELENLFKKNK